MPTSGVSRCVISRDQTPRRRSVRQNGRDPREKLLIFSDGMDVTSIIETYRRFHGQVRTSFGWGTNLTNDFVGCDPDRTVDLYCRV